MKLTYRHFLTLLAFCIGACKPDVVTPSGPSEPGSFAFSPMEIPQINFILSLGWINPSGHTIPTDHIYFHFQRANTSDPLLPVYAPGSGVVMKILPVPVGGVNECKIWVRMNDKFVYYLDHIVLNNTIKEGTSVTGGIQVGTTGLGNSIDFGVIDENLTLGFANPARYGWEILHSGKPLQYFEGPIQAQLYALVDREGSDKDGEINLDIPGTLAGNWFLDGATFYTDGPDGWDKELSFAVDSQHPAKVLVSIGGVLGLTGKWSIPAGAPMPSVVSASNGKVAYPLWSPFDPVQRGIMIVQLLDDTHIKVEVFVDLLVNDANFDANARIYAR